MSTYNVTVGFYEEISKINPLILSSNLIKYMYLISSSARSDKSGST